MSSICIFFVQSHHQTYTMRAIILFLLLSVNLFAQKPSTLPRSTPEAEGVSSQGIINFLEAAKASKHEFHSFMILRHGKVIAEGWWNPYRPDLKHTMYSVSKSFTATAVGFAVSEKLLSVNDKVISFFPDDLPANISPNLAELRIKDLLSMSVGHDKEPTGPVVGEKNWVEAFLQIPIPHQPGTKFVYNSVATFMLSAIVQKVTKQKILDYLQPRLFSPLGIQGIDWEVNPQGINVGGWGLRLKTEDMAKFGQLFLQKGMWQGKQILPAAWVEEASTMKIMQNPSATAEQMKSSDWLQGYCYQMWRSRHNSYRGDGANGQYILVLPEQDAVIITTAEAPDMQGEINLIWEHLLPAFQPKKLPAEPKVRAALGAKIAGLFLPLPPKSPISATQATLKGKNYGVFTGNKNLQQVSFDFVDNIAYLNLQTDTALHRIAFGFGQWIEGTTTKIGPYLVAGAQSNRVGIGPYKVAGAYVWKDDKTIEFSLRYIESPHTETIVCSLDGDYLSLDFQNIFNRRNPGPIAKAILAPKTSNPARLIVRGDDMGYSHSGNEALIKCYREGIQTSIEVIVPSPWFPEAVKMLAQNPGTDVGLHFAITSEWDNIKWRPLTDAPSLRNADGYFYPMIYPNAYYPKQSVMTNAWKIEDIEKELRAQIEMAKKYIPNLSHISGHMNSTGFDPAVKAMARRVAAEYKLPMVDVDAMQDHQISYTGFEFGKKTTEQRIQGFIEMLDKLEAGKTYVFVEHPGLDNAELRAIHHIGYEDVAQGRQDVTTIFTSEKVKEALVKKGIKLVSYREALKR